MAFLHINCTSGVYCERSPSEGSADTTSYRWRITAAVTDWRRAINKKDFTSHTIWLPAVPRGMCKCKVLLSAFYAAVVNIKIDTTTLASPRSRHRRGQCKKRHLNALTPMKYEWIKTDTTPGLYTFNYRARYVGGKKHWHIFPYFFLFSINGIKIFTRITADYFQIDWLKTTAKKRRA